MRLDNDFSLGDPKVSEFKLLGKIPLFKIIRKEDNTWIFVFGILFLKIKHTPDLYEWRFFKRLPLFKIFKTQHKSDEELKKHFSEIIEKFRRKINQKNKIRVVFMVIYDSVFPGEPLFQKMKNDSVFTPSILVIPDVFRGRKNMLEQMDKTYNSLSLKYPNVYHSWDKNKKKFVDYSDKMDIVCTANPYDWMTYKYYQISKLFKNEILSIFFNYGYPAVSYARKVARQYSLAVSWIVFSESNDIIKEFENQMLNKGENLVLSGYMKLDGLAPTRKNLNKRKKIIIAPHHTIEKKFEETIGLSNFLKYSDFFLKLPGLYPQVDFVFRPHPLLRVALEKKEIWGKKKTDLYFDKIQKNNNVEYQAGGDYFETFMNSDGIIHDCSSFLAEYLFTGNPACYLLRDATSKEKYFMNNGRRIINNCYEAYSEKDILSYIDNVIIAEKDYMKEKRIEFVKNELMINYPNVSDFVLKYIKEKILVG